MFALLLTPILCFAPISQLGAISLLAASACAKYNTDRDRTDAIFFEESSFHNQKTFEKKGM
jgi:hypothetical protein